MSQSVYLTVYFPLKKGENEFNCDLNLAKSIFKYLWKKLGTGFDKNGNIKGLADYYYLCDWISDAEGVSYENGQLKVLKLDFPDRNKNYSFTFHNYGGETKLSEKVDLRDIYLLFGEILATCFQYVVHISDSFDDKEYSVFFDSDGRKYTITDNRSDYIKAVRDFVFASENISESKKKLNDAVDKLDKYKAKLNTFEKSDENEIKSVDLS